MGQCDIISCSCNLIELKSSDRVEEARKRNYVRLERPAQVRTPAVVRWKPPEVGKLKINVDASVYEGENCYTVKYGLEKSFRNFYEGENDEV